MKKNKITKFIIDLMAFAIALGIGDKINNYLAIANKKLFSLDTAICIVILTIILSIVESIFSKIIYKFSTKNNSNKNMF